MVVKGEGSEAAAWYRSAHRSLLSKVDACCGLAPYVGEQQLQKTIDRDSLVAVLNESNASSCSGKVSERKAPQEYTGTMNKMRII